MRRIAWRLDRHGLAVGVGRKMAFADEVVENAVKKLGIAGVKRQFASPVE
jgi:hypothetical protein